MLGRIILPLILAYALLPAASGTLYFGVTPSNATYGEEFITYLKIIDSTSKTITDDGSSIFANYSGTIRQMHPLNTIYSTFGGNSDYWAVSQNYISGNWPRANVTAIYIDTQSGIVGENASANLTMGNLSIILSGASNFNMTLGVGQNVSMEAYLRDYFSGSVYVPPAAAIKYYAFDIKKMEVIDGPKSFSTCTYDATKLCANYTIGASSPIGILSLYATNGTHYGGKNVFFAAMPYSLNPAPNTTFPAVGDAVELALNVNNIYGLMRGIAANITYPNGTIVPAYFTESNGYKQPLIAPNLSGSYIVNATINHGVGGIVNYGASFKINPAYADIRTDKSTYKQGENVSATFAIYDSNGTALASEINATIEIPGGTNTTYPNSSIDSSGNVRTLTHTLSGVSALGAYNVSIIASDGVGRKYNARASFIVNALNKTIIATPSSISHSFSNVSNRTYTISLSSNSTATIGSISVSASPAISPYTTLNRSGMASTLEINGTTSFEATLIGNTSIAGSVSGNIVVTFDGSTLNIPATITNGLVPSFGIETPYNAEAIAKKNQKLSITIRNNGTGALGTITISASADMVPYVKNTTAPTGIASGSSAIAYIDILVPSVGSYSGKITFSAAGATSAQLQFNINALEEFYPAISELSELRKTLNTRLLALESNGITLPEISSSISDLQDEISDLNSLYDNGRYSEAKEKLDELQSEAIEIQVSLDAVESPSVTNKSGASDGTCDEDESCSSPDCAGEDRCDAGESPSGGTGTILIIVVLVVIIAAVLATSIMPDENAATPVPV